MPRGNPNIGKLIKSPGRPPKANAAHIQDAKRFVDDEITKKLPKIVETLFSALDCGDTKEEIKAANILLERLLGTPVQKQEGRTDKLVVLFSQLRQAHLEQVVGPQTPVIEHPGNIKVLPAGTVEDDRTIVDGDWTTTDS